MQNKFCVNCGKSKALLNCGVCAVFVCKHCAQILEEDSFSFLDQKSPAMSHSIFCNSCFDQNILTELEDYNNTLNTAKNIEIYFKDQSKETRLMKRIDTVLTIENCKDRDEIFMRLAFKAVKLGFNAVIDVDINGKKVRMGAYQTYVYSATGVPTNVHPSQIIRDRSIWQNRN